MKRFPSGSARQFTFISCGHTINSIHLAIHDGTETLVYSHSSTASAAGYYYNIWNSVTSPGIYTATFFAQYGQDDAAAAATWKEGQRFELVLDEVD